MKEKVVLAYSGGLDTSYCVKYLSEELSLEVYTALANTGGFTEAELKTVEKKAYALGAKEHVNPVVLSNIVAISSVYVFRAIRVL